MTISRCGVLFINWRTDSLLFDSESTPPNRWETANSLIKTDKITQIPQIDFPTLPLYPIMIRKIDFLSSDRLLQTLPYISLNTTWSGLLRKQSLNLAERCKHYFADSTADHSIRTWQKKVIKYCEQQHRIPLPIFRLLDAWEQPFQTYNQVAFQSARGESFHLPTKITNDLAYFLGVVIGDGHLTCYNIQLVDFSPNHMLMIQSLAHQLFGIQGKISGEENIWTFHLNNKWAVRLVNFLTDQPIGGQKYDSLKEPFILKHDKHFRRHFWSGVLDADGSYKRYIGLTSKTQVLIEDFGSFLQEQDISFKIRSGQKYGRESFDLLIHPLFKREVSQLLIPRHPVKKQEFQTYTAGKIYRPRKKYSDEFALLQQENQELRFHTFNIKQMVSDGSQTFFDFSVLPTLGVLQCQDLLKALRIHLSWTQRQLADYLLIPEKMITSYERTSDITIQLLEKLLPFFPESQPKSLMLFLKQNDLITFRSRKTVAMLPLQPSNELLKLLQQLELRRDYLLINPKNGHKDQVRGKLSNYFSIPKPVGYKLSNSVVYQFARTFYQIGASTED